MSFIKHPLRPSDITQDDPLYYIYETTQSMAISFDVVNNAGAILVNYSDHKSVSYTHLRAHENREDRLMRVVGVK